MNEEGIEEDERHIEITIGDPVAEKVIDSCVGTDNRRYYKVKWQATWESEEELIGKYQNLIEDYWKVTVAQNDLEHKNMISNLLENITSQQEEIVTERDDKANAENQPEAQKEAGQGQEVVVDDVEFNEEMLSFYKQVNSPEHKISDEPLPPPTAKKPPPLMPKKETEEHLPHTCDECGRSYSTARKLKDHQRKLHMNQGLYQCSECPKQFPTKRALQMHMNRHTGIGPHQCPGCGKRYMTPQELQFHKRSCNELVEKEFPCEQCGKRFATKTHLVFHMKIHLPDEEKPFKCQFCTRTFAYNHDCVHHMRLHLGEKPFKCTECDKAFHRKSYLTEHMFVHTGVSRYQCQTCQSFFKTQQMLQTHVKNVHILKKEPGTRGARGSNKNNTKKKIYKCEKCNKEFKYIKEYHFHQAVNHKESAGKSSDDKEEVLAHYEPTMYYKCKKCDKTFRWLSVLKKHAETHSDSKRDDEPVKTEAVEESNNEALKDGEEVMEVVDGIKPQEVEVKEVTIEQGQAVLEGEEGEEAITVCYLTHKGKPLENGEELKILACGHCLAGFTDEEELNQHVLTQHADLILQSEEVAVEHESAVVAGAEEQVVTEEIAQLDRDGGMKIIQLALEAKQQELEAMEQQKQQEIALQQQDVEELQALQQHGLQSLEQEDETIVEQMES